MASEESGKPRVRKHTSDSETAGNRGAGSVGERPELAGSRDSGNRTGASGKKHSIAEELDNTTANDPGLGGE